MYQLGKHQFDEFKYRPGHRANYAILRKPGNREWGIKYSPSYSYSREYDVLKKLSHPQIPKRYDCGKSDLFENDKHILKEYYIVEQHFEGEDIVHYYKERGVPDAAEIENVVKYFTSIAHPLQYLHDKRKSVHTDIKPGHLIVDSNTGVVGLIDLELTIKIGETIKGMTREYASPEQKQMGDLLKNSSDKKDEKAILSQVTIDGRSDLYSIGLILFEVLTGQPWADNTQPPVEINKSVPQKLNEIVMGLLEENKSQRIPSAEKLREELACV